MSTFSTNQADENQRGAEQTLQCLQGSIVLYYAWAADFTNEIKNLRKQEPFTAKEFSEQQNAIAFKERQLNETQVAINRLEERAHAIARALGITP